MTATDRPRVRLGDIGWEVVWLCCSILPEADPRIARTKFTPTDAGRARALQEAAAHWTRTHTRQGMRA